MKIYNLKFSETILSGKVELSTKVAILDDLYAKYELFSNLLDRTRNEIKNPDSDSAVDLLLSMEEVLVLNLDIINELAEACSASTIGLRRRVYIINMLIKDLKKEIEPASELFIPFSTEELMRLEKLLSEIVGNTACFITTQFNVSDLLDVDEVEEVSDVLDSFLTSRKMSVESAKVIFKEVRQRMLDESPSIGAFEKYPELLEPFSLIVGTDLYDCEFITVDIIRKVINKEMTLEQFRKFIAEGIENEC